MSLLCSVANIVLLAVLCLVHWTWAANDCSFVRSYKNEQCVYNIHLTQNENCDYGGRRHYFHRHHGNMQNDNNEKIDTMEKTFSFMKDEHEQRLKHLEGTVRDLLDKDSSLTSLVTSSLDLKNKPSGHGQTLDNDLLTRLHQELGNLRNALKHKTEQLFDIQLKINETEKMFERSQVDLLSVNGNLMKAENKIAVLERERAVLKNQLKDRSYKLGVSSQRLTDCEAKTVEQQEQLLTLIRSENTLSEGLMTSQLLLNQTKDELQELETSHRELKGRHTRIRQVLSIRERELIDCYGAKTQTFCGFENRNLCGFIQPNDTSDFFDWDWGKGKTPSRHTGPSADHTCGTSQGHFMYIEASAKGRGKNAIIYSPLYRGLKQQCVEFYYHMMGRHIGTLNVYAKARGATEFTSVWRAWGNQGNVWSVARLAIPKQLARAGYQIAFEGITERGYQGDISIDDVSVTDGRCTLREGVQPVLVTISDSVIIDEGKQFARHVRKQQLAKVRSRMRKRDGN